MTIALLADVELVKADVPAGALQGLAHLRDWLGAIPLRTASRLRCFAATTSPALHLYLELPAPSLMEGGDIAIVEDIFSVSFPEATGVPVCVRASRFLNHAQGPASRACYDLQSQETLGSDSWLAARNTEWSDPARPYFTNPRRTMFTSPVLDFPALGLQK